MRASKAQLYCPSLEERAFLYQEAQDLESMMKDLGSLSVMVEKLSAAKSRREYRVTFMVAPETVGMEVQAVNANLFVAAMAAKEETFRQLSAILSLQPTRILPELLH